MVNKNRKNVDGPQFWDIQNPRENYFCRDRIIFYRNAQRERGQDEDELFKAVLRSPGLDQMLNKRAVRYRTGRSEIMYLTGYKPEMGQFYRRKTSK